MNRSFMLGALLLVSVFSSGGWADQKAIRESLKQALPGMEPDSISPTKIKGLYEVMYGPKLFYVSEDGDYLIQGSMVDVRARQDLTEPRVAEARVSSLARLGPAKMIVFKPERPRYTAYVFTDIDCGYCRKLHTEIKQYLDAGIEIRYLFFPRAGEGSDSYKKAVTVWCSDDRNLAMTKAKKGESLPAKTCDNPVSAHMGLGSQFGASGTPMIVTAKGAILPGYVPASQLAQVLEQEQKS